MKYWAIDMGNTTCEFALIQNSQILDKFFVKSKPLNFDLISDKLRLHHHGSIINTLCLISSVVPSNNNSLCDFLKQKFNFTPQLISHDLFDDDLIASSIEKNTVGIDILCKSLWAKHYNKTANLIMDLGTASVIQYMNEEKKLELVSIGIGLNAMYDVLGYSAELLPKNLNHPNANLTSYDANINTMTSKVMGNNTLDAILGGVYWGYVGVINSLVLKSKEQTNCKLVYLTGGRLKMLKNDLNFDFINNQDIIFKGIDVIFKQHFNKF